MKKVFVIISLALIILTGCSGQEEELPFENRQLANLGVISVTDERAPVFDVTKESLRKDNKSFILELTDVESVDNTTPVPATVEITGTKKNFELILHFEDQRKDLHYRLPDDMIKPISLNKVYDPVDFPLYLITESKNKTVKYYKINLVDETIAEYQPVAIWDDSFRPSWIYEGEQVQNYVVDDVGNRLLILNHDGGISGYHDHSYLTAIDKKTGKEIWSVYAGYMGAQYTFNKKEKYVFVGVNVKYSAPSELYCIDHKTGHTLWSKKFDEKDLIEGLVSVKNTVVVLFNVNDRYKMEAYRESDGKKLWQRTLQDDQVLLDTRNMNRLILYNRNGITAYNVKNMKQKWYLDQKLQVKSDSSFSHPGTVVTPDPITYQKKARSEEKWFAAKDGFIKVNINKGKVLQTLSAPDSRLLLLDNEYGVIMKYPSKDDSEANTVSTSYEVINLKENKVIYRDKGHYSGGVLDRKQFIHIRDNTVQKVDLKTGKILWKTYLESTYDPFEDTKMLKPVAYKNLLIIPQKDHMMVFNKTSGEILYQVADYLLPESPLSSHKIYKVYYDGRRLFISRMNHRLVSIRSW